MIAKVSFAILASETKQNLAYSLPESNIFFTIRKDRLQFPDPQLKFHEAQFL